MKKYKVIICIPTFVGIKAELADQFIQLGGYAKEKGYPVITIPNKTHVDARNWLATGGGGFQNSKMLINVSKTFLLCSLAILANGVLFHPSRCINALRPG